MANLDDRITVFLKDGVPRGTCPAGQEAEWGRMKDGPQHPYDSTISSTERKWQAYARHNGKDYTRETQLEAVQLLY